MDDIPLYKKSILALHFSLFLIISDICFAVSLEKAIEAYEFEEYEDAFKWLKPWANDGDPEAQYRLGLLYEKGNGVDLNTRLALKWYRLAAEVGHRAAKRRLKNLRKSASNVIGGTESVATQWYQDSAEEGDPEAQYNLAFMLETGWSVPVDDIEAARWYEKAAEKGIQRAQFRLSLMYLVGAGLKQSEIQGEKWLRNAAKNDHPLADIIREKILDADELVKLNIDIVKVINKVRKVSIKNPKKAGDIVMDAVRAAELKVAKDRVKKKKRLAKIQNIESAKNQEIVSDDALLGAGGRKTFRWYKVKAERGLPEAQYQLGKIYEVGLEVKKDLSQAVHWFGLAAEQGHVEAQYYLGVWYANGIAVTQNETLASRYLAAAAKKGHEKASKLIEKSIDGNLRDNHESIAVWWLKQMALQGSAGARYRLGYLYEQGRGVERNVEIAKKLYALAVKQGNQEAEERLRLVENGDAPAIVTRVEKYAQRIDNNDE